MSDDSISRQAAINVTWEETIYTDPLNVLTDVREKIKALPSAQPEQRWIPCSERLPVQNGVYVVTRTISDRFEYNNITDCCYFDGTNTWHDDTRVNHGRKYLADVIAWQPLPEPYKADVNNL